MGRCYFGDIGGKFWFGIQSGADADHFGVEGEEGWEYRYLGCGCCCIDCGDEPNQTTKHYCEDCFSSYQEHQDAIENEISDWDGGNLWRESGDGLLHYTFDADNTEEIKQVLTDIEAEVPEVLDFTFTYKKGEYDLTKKDWEDVDKATEPKQVLMARWCLGKQILACLEEHETCHFAGEL